ncbi:MAG: hypothetical protein ACP5UA_04625 [Candidatus Hydrogenedens sp.]
MTSFKEKQSQNFLYWSQRQQAWLKSQIKSAENLKLLLEKNNLDNEIETEIKKHGKQNEQLNTLIQEYDILRKEIPSDILKEQKNQEIIKGIKELIQTLIKINDEIYQIVLKQKENLQKEMGDFFSLKSRFEKYNPQGKKLSENVDYDV